MEKKDLEYYKIKCEDQRATLKALQHKIDVLEKGKPSLRHDLLGLKPEQTYLIITKGRRLICEIVFETKKFICYKKQKYDTKYYINKRYVEVIKELNYTHNTNQEDDDL